jgi:hypothetical protein
LPTDGWLGRGYVGARRLHNQGSDRGAQLDGFRPCSQHTNCFAELRVCVDRNPGNLPIYNLWNLVFHKPACWRLHRSQPRFRHSWCDPIIQSDDLMAGDADDIGGGNDASCPMRLSGVFQREEKGSVALEAAIAMSTLLFLILGGIEFSQAYFMWNTMLLAAEEAGRYAMLFHKFPNSPPGCADTLANCAVDWANQNMGNNMVRCTSGCNGTQPTITFNATYTFSYITPITLTRSVTVPVL